MRLKSRLCPPNRSLGCSLFCVLVAVSACGGDSGDGDSFGTGTGVGTDTGLDADTSAEADDSSDTDEDIGDDVDDLDEGFDDSDDTPIECSSVSETAENIKLPADILFVVDNSSSMKPGNDTVQNNLNSFAAQIVQSGVDARVVLLSRYPDTSSGCAILPLTCDPGICVPAPLGSGGCPTVDNNPPGFVHIDQFIGSTNGLQRLIERYPDWSSSLREDSIKHLVVITDDNANMSAAEFDAQFTALDDRLADYTMHGIVNLTGALNCAIVGGSQSAVYIQLINQTGGTAADYCQGDGANYDQVFVEIATAVESSAPLACEWLIPEPPGGTVFDKDKVNVEFFDGVNSLLIGYIGSEAGCAGIEHGWYYDDPTDPTYVRVCPQTCAMIQGASSATIDIQFGCDTIPVG